MGAEDSTYDISNLARLGQSERQLVQLLIDGVNKLIEMDKALGAGKPIDGMLPAGVQLVIWATRPGETST